jgi:hypothetical protein
VVLERYELNSSVLSSYLQVHGPPTSFLSIVEVFLIRTFYLNFEDLLSLQLTNSLLRMACSAVTIKTHTLANRPHSGMKTVLVTTPAELRNCNNY